MFKVKWGAEWVKAVAKAIKIAAVVMAFAACVSCTEDTPMDVPLTWDSPSALWDQSNWG